MPDSCGLRFHAVSGLFGIWEGGELGASRMGAGRSGSQSNDTHGMESSRFVVLSSAWRIAATDARPFSGSAAA